MFASQGYAATSVDRLATACRVGKDTIYRRFPSKRALFDAAVERLRARVLDQLKDVTDQSGPADERLRRMARWFLEINLEPELVALRRIALSEAVLAQDAVGSLRTDPIMDRLIEGVVAAQKDGVLCDGFQADFLAEQLLHAIIAGPVNEAMLGRKTYAATFDRDTYFTKAWTMFLKGAQR